MAEEIFDQPITPWAAICMQYGLDPNTDGLIGFKLYGGLSMTHLLCRVDRAPNGTDVQIAYTDLDIHALHPRPPYKRIRGPKRRSSRRLAVQRKRVTQGLPPDGKIPGWTRKQTRIVAGRVPAIDMQLHVAYIRVQQHLRRSTRRLVKLARALQRRQRRSGRMAASLTPLRLVIPQLPYDAPPYPYRQRTGTR